MKILILLLIFLMQQNCFAASNINQNFYNHRQHLYNRALFNRGVMTGIPYPIYQNNPIIIPEVQQPVYVKRKHIKKKYRKYYPKDTENSFIILEY